MSPVALWHLCIDCTEGKIVDYTPSQNAPSIHLIVNEKTSLLVNQELYQKKAKIT